MNKKIALLAITLLFPLAATAQRGGDYDYEEPDKEIESQVNSNSNNGREFHYGVKVGLNFTTVSSDADDIQAKVGQMGFLCRWQWEKWAIQPELIYSKMGVRSLEKEIQWNPDEVWRLNGQDIKGHRDLMNDEDFKIGFYTKCIQVPVMFKYYAPIFDRGLNIQAGPVLSVDLDYDISTPIQKGYLKGYYFGEREQYRSNGERRVTGVESMRYLGRDRNRVGALAQFGIGYDSKSGIGVDFRCAMGLTPVFKNYYNTNAKYRVWSISFSYVF
ncbi:MAG: porin family protein [Bacteroidia bacterium]|nr:porin family protein [Bacteroidia bacterium]